MPDEPQQPNSSPQAPQSPADTPQAPQDGLSPSDLTKEPVDTPATVQDAITMPDGQTSLAPLESVNAPDDATALPDNGQTGSAIVPRAPATSDNKHAPATANQAQQKIPVPHARCIELARRGFSIRAIGKAVGVPYWRIWRDMQRFGKFRRSMDQARDLGFEDGADQVGHALLAGAVQVADNPKYTPAALAVLRRAESGSWERKQAPAGGVQVQVVNVQGLPESELRRLESSIGATVTTPLDVSDGEQARLDAARAKRIEMQAQDQVDGPELPE